MNYYIIESKNINIQKRLDDNYALILRVFCDSSSLHNVKKDIIDWCEENLNDIYIEITEVWIYSPMLAVIIPLITKEEFMAFKLRWV